MQRPLMGALDDEREESERLEEYSSALHAAAANGHRLVVRYLLKKQADIDLLTVSPFGALLRLSRNGLCSPFCELLHYILFLRRHSSRIAQLERRVAVHLSSSRPCSVIPPS